MTAALKYTTVARARRKHAWARVATDTVNDFLASAEAWAEQWCGREFDSKSRTEKLDGNGGRCLLLKHTPITSISACAITDESGTVTSLTPSTDLVFDADSGLIEFSPTNAANYSHFPRSHIGNVSVTYTGGHTTIPDNVQEAIALKALADYAQSSLYLNAGLGSENIGGATSTRIAQSEIEAMVRRAEEYLQPYVPQECL